MSYYESATRDRVDLLRRFQEEVTSADIRIDAEFQRILRDAQALLEVSEQEIADGLGVSRPTVNRWMNGKNLPYYGMRKPAISWIRERLILKVKRLEASARQFASSYSGSSIGSRTEALVAKSQ